jgi:hypothetical protein
MKEFSWLLFGGYGSRIAVRIFLRGREPLILVLTVNVWVSGSILRGTVLGGMSHTFWLRKGKFMAYCVFRNVTVGFTSAEWVFVKGCGEKVMGHS